MLRWGRLPLVVGVTHLSTIILVGIALLFVPAACAGKGASMSGKPAERWKVTWHIYDDVDPGGGTIARYDRAVVVTPTQIQESTTGEEEGRPIKRESPPTPLAGERRQAIAALLPWLRGQAGSYSTHLGRDDEGFHGVSVTVEIDGEAWCFEIDDDSQAPRPPAALLELHRLVFGKKASLAAD
jgi:hypothetical protein